MSDNNEPDDELLRCSVSSDYIYGATPTDGGENSELSIIDTVIPENGTAVEEQPDLVAYHPQPQQAPVDSDASGSGGDHHDFADDDHSGEIREYTAYLRVQKRPWRLYFAKLARAPWTNRSCHSMRVDSASVYAD